MAAVREGRRGAVPAAGAGGLMAWAEESGRRAGGFARGGLRFVFYGRVSTEDWQDPVTSRARQREQAEALVRGHGVIVAELFDVGESASIAALPVSASRFFSSGRASNRHGPLTSSAHWSAASHA